MRALEMKASEAHASRPPVASAGAEAIGDMLRSESQALAEFIVSREAMRSSELEHRRSALLFPVLKEKERVPSHREAILALAGVIENGRDALGHRSDWLRNHTYLLHHLEPRRLSLMAGLEVDALRRYLAGVKAVSDLDAIWQIMGALVGLHAELGPALAAFEALRQVTELRLSSVEQYWDASAQKAALFTIDWASFGREDLFEHNGWRSATWLRENGFAEPGFHILQVGCGVGRIEKHLAGMAAQVTGVDISASMVNMARQRLAELSNVSFKKSDGTAIDAPSGTVDVVFSFLVFIHIHDPAMCQGIFESVWRVLKPGGRFVLTTSWYAVWVEGLARELGFAVERIVQQDSWWANSFGPEMDWLYVLRKP
jgi:2-polyprenyl-3-methyl-5-hydroxy-6-metoxy-1,4-benzoquinol methylase